MYDFLLSNRLTNFISNTHTSFSFCISYVVQFVCSKVMFYGIAFYWQLHACKTCLAGMWSQKWLLECGPEYRLWICLIVCLTISLSVITTACPILLATVLPEHIIVETAFKFKFLCRGNVTILHVYERRKMFLLVKCLKRVSGRFCCIFLFLCVASLLTGQIHFDAFMEKTYSRPV